MRGLHGEKALPMSVAQQVPTSGSVASGCFSRALRSMASGSWSEARDKGRGVQDKL